MVKFRHSMRNDDMDDCRSELHQVVGIRYEGRWQSILVVFVESQSQMLGCSDAWTLGRLSACA